MEVESWWLKEKRSYYLARVASHVHTSCTGYYRAALPRPGENMQFSETCGVHSTLYLRDAPIA